LILSENKGAVIAVHPLDGVLEPFEMKQLEVVAYNNMWGCYSDTISLKIAGIKNTPT